MGIIIDIWDALLLQPMLNALIFLYGILASNFGLSIIAFTIAVRIAMYPLTRKQLNASRAMSRLQPRIQEIRQKYGKDSQKVTQETMRLYKEEGVNPIGCLGPMVVQLPIWIGLYQAVIQTLPSTPERLATLSNKFYSGLSLAHEAVPLNGRFLWMDLALPDPSPIILPLLVGVSMYVLQKMTTMPSASPQQDSTNRMLLWMMPVMFGFFTLNFPSGLAVYWVVSNVIGVVIQGFVTGWDPLRNLFKFGGTSQPAPAPAMAASSDEEAAIGEGVDRDNGQDSRGGHRARPKGARRRSRRSRNRRR